MKTHLDRLGKACKKNTLLLVGLVVLVSISLQACSPQTELNVADQAPEFTLPSSEGERVSLDKYVGKQPVLLFFHMAVG